MAVGRKRLSPVGAGWGECIRLAPAVADVRSWLDQIFDWESNAVVVDMFAGAGGLSFGFDSVPGSAVLGAFEQHERAAETHAANIPGAVFTSDVREVDSFELVLKESGIRRVDVLSGGPPCQGFSRLGKGALRRLALENGRGADLSDPRNFLFREFMRAVRELQPQVVVIENVPDMAVYQPIMEEIRDVFAELDYLFDKRILSAEEYGVPQRRQRLFMVANRHGEPVDWPIPTLQRYTLRDAISDLPPVPAGHRQEEVRRHAPANPGPYVREMRRGLRGHNSRIVWDHVTRLHREEDIEAFAYMCEGERYAAVPEKLRRYRVDIFKDKYHRMIWDYPSWTVTAHLAKDGYKYIHPEQDRTISVREAARIQSFPDRFRFAGTRTDRFRQVGNAVPPKLAQAVGASVRSLVR